MVGAKLSIQSHQCHLCPTPGEPLSSPAIPSALAELFHDKIHPCPMPARLQRWRSRTGSLCASLCSLQKSGLVCSQPQGKGWLLQEKKKTKRFLSFRSQRQSQSSTSLQKKSKSPQAPRERSWKRHTTPTILLFQPVL